jgi:transcription factor C subunit 7
MICIGRVLTGRMPEKEEEEDFNCGTCSLSVFQRRVSGEAEVEREEEDEIVQQWDANQPDHIPRVAWRDGKGVAGGWECVVNGSCAHLKNGEERAWLVPYLLIFLLKPFLVGMSLCLRPCHLISGE